MAELASKVDVLAWVARARQGAGDRPLMHHETFWSDGFLVKLFDGPTPQDRSDFHINPRAEFFYQLVGDMECHVINDGRRESFVIEEGEMYVIPRRLPHLNRRPPGSIGLVIHEQRLPDDLDGVAWYCDDCGHQLFRKEYRFEDLRKQLPILVSDFLASETLRTCDRCHAVMAPDRGRM